jgi:hypothetical protein
MSWWRFKMSRPKISAEVSEVEMSAYKAAAALKSMKLSEWIRMKLNEGEAPPQAVEALAVTPPLTEAAPPPVVTPPVAAPLPKNPLPAHLAGNVSLAAKRAMLFEAPDRLPAYRPPERGEGPAAHPLTASHPVAQPPRPNVENVRVTEAVRVSEHPCVHLRVGAPGNLRAGDCPGTCGSRQQSGRPCFWNLANAQNCLHFHAKVSAIVAVGQQTSVYPTR